MSELVQKLSIGDHPVVPGLRPTSSVEALKACIDRGFVLIRFTDTRGGTELGIKLDPAASDVGAADFATGQGAVTLVGNLSLDYVSVRCVATIDLATLAGTGHLEPLPEPALATAQA